MNPESCELPAAAQPSQLGAELLPGRVLTAPALQSRLKPRHVIPLCLHSRASLAAVVGRPSPCCRNVIYGWALAAQQHFPGALGNLQRSAGPMPGSNCSRCPGPWGQPQIRAEGGAAAPSMSGWSNRSQEHFVPHIPSTPPHPRACVAAFLTWSSWSSVPLPAPREGDPALLVGLEPCLSHFDAAGRGSRAPFAPHKCVKVSLTALISPGIERSPVSLSLNPEESKEMKQ